MMDPEQFGAPEKELTPWEILGVPENASLEEIISAFRIAAKQVHKDVGGSDREFKQIKAAYDRLKKIKEDEKKSAETEVAGKKIKIVQEFKKQGEKIEAGKDPFEEFDPEKNIDTEV